MKPVVLAILDGWGYSRERAGNPILEAKKPTMDRIAAAYPMVLLQASGLAVGLNWGNFGNSEVGHLTIGAGRIVPQYQTRIAQAIQDGSFFENQVLARAFSAPTVHLIGLLTSGNVHAEYSHILALVELAVRKKHAHTLFHLFTDGKDSGLREGGTLLRRLQHDLASRQSSAQVASIIGRDFGMDRDNNWELTQKAFDLIAHGRGAATEDFVAALERSYAQGMTDTKIPALAALWYRGVQENDALLFFNFREDSIRQLFQKCGELKNVYRASFTKYFDASGLRAAFPPPDVRNNLAEVVSNAGFAQLHVAETLKYAHVTYFFNGLRNASYPGEDDMLLPSVKDIEREPAMGAPAIADRIIGGLEQGRYQFIVANFANADMLAHTGNHEATRAGVEALDAAMGRILKTVLAADATFLITADHGNAEKLIDRLTGEQESKHGNNPVPFYLVDRSSSIINHQQNTEIVGILADIAPTILELMNLPQPPEMTGRSLLPELGIKS